MNIRHWGMSGGNIKLQIWQGERKKNWIFNGVLIYLLVVILVGEAAKPDRTSKTAQPARRLRVLSTGEIIVKLRITHACSVQTDKWSKPLQNRATVEEYPEYEILLCVAPRWWLYSGSGGLHLDSQVRYFLEGFKQKQMTVLDWTSVHTIFILDN